MNEKKMRECEGHCGRTLPEDEMGYGPDPFAEEIYGDLTEYWLCDDCYTESALDI